MTCPGVNEARCHHGPRAFLTSIVSGYLFPARSCQESSTEETNLPQEWPNPSPDLVIVSPYVDHIAYGVRQLSSMVRSRGFSTRLVFLPHLQPIQYLEYDFSQPYSETVLDQLSDLCRDVPFVGISMMSNNFFQAVQVTRHLREKTQSRIIWGGVHPTVRPEECLAFADYVCIGEGEEALARFLELHRDGGDPSEALIPISHSPSAAKAGMPMFTALHEKDPPRRISIRLRRLFLVRLVTTGISTFSRRSSVRKGG